MIKEEDKDDSENALTLKCISPLSSTEPTELPQVVPRVVQCTETVFTGTIHTRGEELHSILTPNQPTHHDGSEDLSHRLTLRSNSRIQLTTDHHQPLLELLQEAKTFTYPTETFPLVMSMGT